MQVDELEEAEHLLGTVAGLGVIEDLAGRQVHGGEQVGGAVAFVVVGHGVGPARLHRQTRLGAVQRLALGLLVEAEHHGPFRRVQVQADDIDELGFEVGVGGDLERVDPPRLQPVITPDTSDGVLADAVTFGHQPGRPMCRPVIGLVVQRVGHHCCDGSLSQPGPASPPRRDPPHSFNPTHRETRPPTAHRVRCRVTPPGDLPVRRSLRRQQQRLGVDHLTVRQHRRPRHRLQRIALAIGDLQPSSNHNRHGPP